MTYLLNEKGAGVFSAIFITGIFAIGIISILMEKVEWLIGVGKKMDGIFNFLKSRNILLSPSKNTINSEGLCQNQSGPPPF